MKHRLDIHFKRGFLKLLEAKAGDVRTLYCQEIDGHEAIEDVDRIKGGCFKGG